MKHDLSKHYRVTPVVPQASLLWFPLLFIPLFPTEHAFLLSFASSPPVDPASLRAVGGSVTWLLPLPFSPHPPPPPASFSAVNRLVNHWETGELASIYSYSSQPFPRKWSLPAFQLLSFPVLRTPLPPAQPSRLSPISSTILTLLFPPHPLDIKFNSVLFYAETSSPIPLAQH